MRERIVSVFGTGKAQAGEPAFELAYAVGRVLAEAGYVIANGGYGGTMAAGAKGAREAGGEVIGVTCEAFGGAANEYVTREVVTATLDERLDKLISLGAGYVVLPGGTGTLLELAKVWELRHKGFVDREKPVLLVGDFWEPLMKLMEGVDRGCAQWVERVSGPGEMVEKLKVIV
jgi:uncharacterized protein (TIGR00725 family)